MRQRIGNGARRLECAIRRGVGHDVQVRAREGAQRRCGGIPTFQPAQEEEAVCDGDEEREDLAERVVRFDLALFEGATGLERFEILFDGPAAPIDVDDALERVLARCLLRGEEHPFDGGLVCWGFRLPHSDDVDPKRSSFQLGIPRSLQRHLLRSDRDSCSTTCTLGMTTALKARDVLDIFPLTELNFSPSLGRELINYFSEAAFAPTRDDRPIELPRTDHESRFQLAQTHEELEKICFSVGYMNSFKAIIACSFHSFDAANPAQ